MSNINDTNCGAATPFDKVLHAAIELLRSGGVDALSMRAVAAASGVQPPTIYRQFGDKERLLDTVGHFVLQEYLGRKRRIIDSSHDPVDALRELWDLHVDFGLELPAAYILAYGDPCPGKTATAAMQTIAMLRQAIARIGDQGRLRVGVERATRIVHASGVGIVLTMLALPPHERDHRLFAVVRDNTLRAILGDDNKVPEESLRLPARAIALAETMRGAATIPMTAAERAVFTEWLNRLADAT
jgi:AcrR family transcriptional regulator